MGKRIAGIAVIVVLALVSIAGGAVFAAGGSAPEGKIVVIPGTAQMETAKPFEVLNVQWTKVAQAGKVWPGQVLAEGKVQIQNISPFPYGIYLRAEPITVQRGNGYPCFDVRTSEGGYGSVVVPPATAKEVGVTIAYCYGSDPAKFAGLQLLVEAGPPQQQTLSTPESPGKG